MALNSGGPVNVGQSERVLSTVLGAALVVNGVLRPSLWHTVLAFAGAALAQRGLSGHCSLYNALGVETTGQGALSSVGPRRGISNRPHDNDPVTEASEESFPASDPPSFTPVAGSTRH